jgi:hypothetical protein
VFQQHIAHARQVLPDFAANFVIGNLFADEDLDQLRQPYRLVMVGFNRLLEVSEERACQFTSEIRRWCDNLLVYRYPSAEPTSDLETLADRFGLRITGRARDAIVASGCSG